MNRRCPRFGRRHAGGFSLIEMIAAFLVFAISLGVLMQVLTSSIRSARQSSDYTMAALWAQTRLDAVGVGEPLETGQSSGRFDDHFRWELDIHEVDAAAIEPPVQAPLGDPQAAAYEGQTQAMAAMNAGQMPDDAPFLLYQLDLAVSWGGGRNPRVARFTTLRAVQPEQGLGMPGTGRLR